LDLVVTAALSSRFNIGYNGTVQSVKDTEVNKTKKWWGSALYLNYDPTSLFGLTLRGEYFNDEKYGLKTVGGGSNIFATTLSANFKIDNFRIIPEFRLDNASKDIFVKSDGSHSKGTATGLLAAVYTF